MAHTITIETESDNDFALLKGLAERLGLPVKENHGGDSIRNADQAAAMKKFIGTWRGDETAEELETMIYNARSDRSREVDL
ncbi:hypothetical protein [Dyadobacter jiangsuensis]|uniref:Uncharacterized protein n=1 Tax=Dyadobacter jiangsuensis TaxID=1591085 RepID=A0A2P8FQG9_9BACT|nr:hypothetical protein [Dyadobacter jiangsuensis]PSL23971.1 hypothetical protein CLV60_115168 [Dyadobacter jiangsuensis]